MAWWSWWQCVDRRERSRGRGAPGAASVLGPRCIVTGGGGLGRPPLPSRQFAACLPLYPTNTHRGRAARCLAATT